MTYKVCVYIYKKFISFMFILLFCSRALNGRWQRGGNASNISTVLRQLGTKCEFIGSLSDSKAFSFLTEDCHDRGILIDHCVYHSTPIAPFSSVILNEASGSRTIIHSNPNMPILTADDFCKIPYELYRWIHFEVSTFKFDRKNRGLYLRINRMKLHLKSRNFIRLNV